MFKKIFIFLFLIWSSSVFASSSSLGLYSVNTNALKIRLGPSSKYPHSYNIYNKQTTNVYEFKDGWARISKFKDNSKWAYAKYLTKVTHQSSSQVKEPKIDTRLLKYLVKSDNYEKHSKVFINVSQRLISNHVCRVSDFKKTSGWIELAKDELYFTYCGGFNKKDKIYINLLTNKIIGNMKKYK